MGILLGVVFEGFSIKIYQVDDRDGDITDKIVIGGDTVNTNALGTYIISYTVSDLAGNETLPRTIRVVIVK